MKNKKPKPSTTANTTSTASASSTSMEATKKLDRMRVIREGHRRYVSKLDQELTAIFQATLEAKDYERLSVIRQLLEGKQKSLTEIDQEILSVCEVEAIDEEIEVSEEVTASIICMKGKIENAMKANVSNQQHVGSPQATAQPVSQNVVRTRLPKLSLPKFKGDVTKWNTFWDSFQSAVHRNEGISNVDKFNYLNSVLEGAAARAIQGLTLTEANYEAAVKLLQERFGRPQQIISAHMDQLHKVSPCSNDRPASLRYVYDQICVHSRGLASLAIGIQETKEYVSQPKEEFVSVKHNGERYEIELPWKNDCLPIPGNLNLCHNRLKSMHYKLNKTPEVLKEYDDIIQEQLASGIIEKVPNPEVERRNKENVHYLPHHAVIRQNRETTKLRIVYDGSAKSPGQDRSLNDCLPVGPNYIPQLVDVLTRFRWNRIAISADIEKAFLMISIQESHRDMLRFLWLKDPFVLNSEVLHLRLCRLVFGLRPSPSILGATITHHLDSYKERYPELVQLIKDSLYVDDLLAGASDVHEGFNIYQQSKELMAKGAFNLRKWNSNSQNLLQLINNEDEPVVQPKTEKASQSIEEEDESFTKSVIGPNQVSDKLVKTLGVCWDTVSDEISLDFKELIDYANTLQVTKRSLLKLSAKVFDPLGLLSPFTITMKCEFQSLVWKS